MAGRDVSRDVRGRLVSATIGLLEREGPDAVQARRLTREIGASTTALYHHFGSMPALLRAVVDEGFSRLGACMSTVEASDDPVADVCALALAYREFACANPHLYDLMFGLGAPGGHRPEPAATAVAAGPAQEAVIHVVGAVARAIEHGRLRPEENAALVAAQLTSMIHGFVALELAGHFRDVEDPVRHVLVPMGVHLLVGLGDDPDRALRSGLSVLAT